MLDIAIEIADNDVRPKFENIWSKITESDIPEYRIMIWGSTIEEKEREPVDLDIMIEYTGNSIEPSKEESIEGWLKSDIHTPEFSYIDPLVIHYPEVPNVISQSRVSRVYSVDEDGWVEF